MKRSKRGSEWVPPKTFLVHWTGSGTGSDPPNLARPDAHSLTHSVSRPRLRLGWWPQQASAHKSGEVSLPLSPDISTLPLSPPVNLATGASQHLSLLNSQINNVDNTIQFVTTVTKFSSGVSLEIADLCRSLVVSFLAPTDGRRTSLTLTVYFKPIVA